MAAAGKIQIGGGGEAVENFSAFIDIPPLPSVILSPVPVEGHCGQNQGRARAAQMKHHSGHNFRFIWYSNAIIHLITLGCSTLDVGMVVR